jgi:mannose-6-phosphate isomerase-like protein (cupin superfamily)
MRKVTVDDVEPRARGPGDEADMDVRALADPLGTEDVAINRYALEPGEAFSGGMHAHLDQEEVFYVLAGTATFEHADGPTADTEVTEVGPGEAIRFAPGEYQQGRNEGGDRVVAIALGAPKDTREGRIAQPCPECDSDALAVVMTDGGMGFECPDCETTVEMEA